VICLDSIDDPKEKKEVIRHLKETKKEIITISEEQMYRFAGNMLEVKGDGDHHYIVMSAAARNSLRPDQVKALERYGTLLSSELETIETCGGGSARCMMAEVFLPKKALLN